MALPDDIAGIRHEWTRLPSHAWTERSIRDIFVAYLDLFLLTHDWVHSMRLEEKFTDTGVNVKKPLDGNSDNFLQRDGVPIINVMAIRKSDARGFEVSIPFPLANDTPNDTVGNLLARATISLETAELESRVS